MIKMNLVDYELVKEVRKLDQKFIIFGIAAGILYSSLSKRIKKLEKEMSEYKERFRDLAIKHNDFVKTCCADKEESEED